MEAAGSSSLTEAGCCFGDEVVAVEDSQPAAGALDRQRPFEGRR